MATRTKFVRVNHRIRVPEVRCIDAEGEQVGVIKIEDAQRMAREKGLDLVEVSPNAKPPVCRIMDYGKYKYEERRKEKSAKKHQVATTLKEVKFHANVEEHDYQTKLAHIKQFLDKGHRVKASLYFRGRENIHRELGFELFKRVARDCDGMGQAEGEPRLYGKNLVLMLRADRRSKHGQGKQENGQPEGKDK